jgi:hypothetical protein
MLRTAFLAAIIASPAWAQSGPNCPFERPIERTIATSQTCTLIACLGRLVCPLRTPGECYRLPADNCNTCTPQRTIICLTPEEALEAERP